MHVVVCIVSYNNPSDCVACIRTLGAATHRDFAVVVCENGSADNVTVLRKSLAAGALADRVQVIHAPENPGYAGGVNICIRATPEADAWWILNPDARPQPDALQHLLAKLASGDGEAIGGTIFYPDGTLQALGGVWRGPFPLVQSLGKGLPVSHTLAAPDLERANFVHGACMLVSRKFVEKVGLMREDYFLYCEEVEWCLRARARGVPIAFAHKAKVMHFQGTTTGSAEGWRSKPWLPVYLDERNKILVLRDTTPGQLWIGVPAGLLLILARFGRRGAWRQMGYALQGWLAGARNQRGKPRRLSQ